MFEVEDRTDGKSFFACWHGTINLRAADFQMKVVHFAFFFISFVIIN